MDDYFNLGTYARSVSTASEDAGRWFNRGLIWCYAFCHEEALRCFDKAIDHDPGFAMAHWGIAYAAGPYYNKQWVRFEALELAETITRTYAASRQALALEDGASEVERALIEALALRFQAAEPVDDLDAWNDDYADAMRKVHAAFRDDPDVCTLFVDALMNRTPWAMWDLATGKPGKGADTLEAVAAVESKIADMAAAGEAPHPGLLHYHIHLLEMSPNPERALRSADALRGLVPDAGHINHMPTHIDAQCGHYQTVVESNNAAIAAESLYVAQHGLINFQAMSRAHSFHFKMYGAMMLGQIGPAMEAARDMLTTLPEELLRMENPCMADWLEGYLAMQVHPPIRFGKWHDILDRPLPDDRELYCSVTAFAHYARTLAHAVLGDVDAAEEEFEVFHQAVAAVPMSRMVFNNTVRDTLEIATAMAHGELTYRKGDFDTAFDHLREAVRLSDNLPYDEPWGWMQPARHALGALLLEQGELEEAEAVYRADLGLDESLMRCCHHPENVWALHGFHESLVRQGKSAEAQLVAPRLTLALARTDVPITASCLCRLECCA
ncbi:MAG: hypothetical protein HKN11_18920 [Rhizobiales bacterium]|nr:hypothetical protein [Hyphomicrobiales bacterium]